MRAAACLLSLALCALPAAPGEPSLGQGGGPREGGTGGAEPVTLTAAASPCPAGSGPAAAGRRRGENRFAERQSIRPLRLLAGEGGGGARRPALSTRVRSGAVRSQVGATHRAGGGGPAVSPRRAEGRGGGGEGARGARRPRGDADPSARWVRAVPGWFFNPSPPQPRPGWRRCAGGRGRCRRKVAAPLRQRSGDAAGGRRAASRLGAGFQNGGCEWKGEPPKRRG